MMLTHTRKGLITMSVFAVFALGFALILSGCQPEPEKAEMHESEISQEGVILEDFYPEDTVMFFSVNNKDDSQRALFDDIKAKFPQEKTVEFMDGLIEEMDLGLKEAGLSFEEDIQPLFKDGHRMAIGIRGDLENEKEDPDMFITLTVNDTQKAQDLLDKLAENEEVESRNILGNPGIENTEEDMYIVLYKDVLLLTNSAKNRDDAVRRVKDNQPSLRSNELFKQSIKDAKRPNLGYFFLDFEALVKSSSEMQKMYSEAVFDLIKTESIYVFAEEEGLNMLVHVMFNPDSDFGFQNMPYEEPYIYKTIPGDKLIVFSEAYNLKFLIDLELKLLLSEKEMAEFDDFKKEFKAMVGLDFDEDIMSWMDKGYAFTLQRNDGIIPGISLFVDASSNPEGAQKVIDLIDAGITQGLATVYAEADEGVPIEQILVKDTTELNGKEVHRVTFDLSSLSDEELLAAGLPSQGFDTPVEIYYGLTGDNYFVFSTYTGLDQEYGGENTVATNPNVIAGREHLNEYGKQFAYVSVEEAVNYIDTFVTLMETLEGPMEEDVKEGLNTVKEYLAPVKYMVSGNKKVENGMAEGIMYIHIAE